MTQSLDERIAELECNAKVAGVLYNHVDAFNDAIALLREVAKDAERYRWLRGPAINNDGIWPLLADSVDESFDRKIDAAIAANKETKK